MDALNLYDWLPQSESHSLLCFFFTSPLFYVGCRSQWLDKSIEN